MGEDEDLNTRGEERIGEESIGYGRIGARVRGVLN